MDIRQLREVFLERLHIEIQLFRDSLLQGSKTDIYTASYMIALYVNLYEILVEQAERMPEGLMRAMVYRPCSILDAFYEEWLKKEDSFYTELRDYVEDELGVISASGRKEDENGGDRAA